MTSLDGDWQVRGCLGREWEWHVGPDKAWDAPGWLPARVPGSVVDDLRRAGEVPDPYHGRNSLLAEWAAERAWVYRRRLDVDGDGAVLRFEGVDHAATVFVDGVEIASHASSFRPFTVAVPAGARMLAVVVHAAPESEPQAGSTENVRVHKSRMGYGWDFCPRMINQGIWRSVAVDGTPERFLSVRLDGDVGVVEIAGEVVLRVDSPELWWPNGMGEQRLYAVDVDGRELSVGFRSVELVDHALVVNGARVPVRGWNWVPVDALYGVPRREKIERLLRLAARSNANLVRVWGGGLIETDDFYDLCDELGLLVWQEFSQSSSLMGSVPSNDAAFVDTMVEEARSIVPRLRRRASLAVWCGGNELEADDSTPVLAALKNVVEELDPGRAWVATSPAGGGDVHGPWEHQGLAAHNARYDDGTWTLHSEFGVEGMTNRRALEALVPEEQRWPADRTNPVYEHLGAFWNNAPLVQEAFGGRIADVETMRRASQWLQYDGLRYAVEASIRRGAGTIPWQLNESYPNAWCTSVIDYHGVPKPAYYGVARAYRGAPSARFATSAWGDAGEARAVVTTPARFVDLDGRVVAEAEGGELIAPLDAFAHDVFLLDLGENRYVMTRARNLEPLLDLPPARVERERAGHTLSLRNAGPVAAIGIVVEDVVCSDNVLDLLPDEERVIEIEGDEVPRVGGWNVRG
ncbi:MAG TPA: glycoside hydrolase family 2 TIM barrel-domain containing protein [Gaiellaceae bacterium]|nr:glycoside hydrolase family 2 TIM barrel-domain containing protein [Gaiellaceae bacterium]